jgi:GSH-dependent disulfide-bond oxidoreductase
VIDLYYWPTPNGWKISIALEEMALPYRVKPVNIGRGEQFAPEFLAISPNGRMPAIVDTEPAGGGAPLAIFESGAILLYLAEKSGCFLPADLRGRSDVLQWLFWQVGGLGPMLGQHGHFRLYANEKIPYAIERYERETRRLYGVLERRLANREHVCGSYSIADMACWPWVVTHKAQGIDLAEHPNVSRWYAALKQRPALRRGYDLGRELRAKP